MKNVKLASIALAGVLSVTLAAIGLLNAGVLTINGAGPVNTVYAGTAAGQTGAGSPGQISVSGTGSVNVNPDVAYVSLGVSTQNTSPKAALERNNQLIAAVIDAVKKTGVAEKDIRTDGFFMNPSYDYGKGTNEVTGYSVSNNVTVTIRDISLVGEVLGKATDAGANVAGSVQFGALDSSAAYNEALALAIANASGKAATIAKSLNLSIGAPASVTESSGGYMPVYTGALNASVADTAGNVPVQTGKLTITAYVSMTYEYPR